MSDTSYDALQTPQAEAASFTNADADLMIDDLSYEDAREYVMHFLVAEKKTEKLLQEKQQQFNTWNERLAYARNKGLRNR